MDKSRLNKLRNATLANLGMAIGSVGVFAVTGNSAFISEAIHDGADTGAHGSRFFAEKLGVDQETKKFNWFLRAGLIGLSALSGYTSYKIGVDIKNGLFEDPNTQENALNLVAAIGVGAGNTYAYKELESIEEQSNASETSLDHGKVDMLASWGLVVFIGAGVAGVEKAPEIGGCLFAGYTSGHLLWHAIRPHKHNH
jgi:divalent metal cation (Fe/Co/Zn/Cd) transporter